MWEMGGGESSGFYYSNVKGMLGSYGELRISGGWWEMGGGDVTDFYHRNVKGMFVWGIKVMEVGDGRRGKLWILIIAMSKGCWGCTGNQG